MPATLFAGLGERVAVDLVAGIVCGSWTRAGKSFRIWQIVQDLAAEFTAAATPYSRWLVPLNQKQRLPGMGPDKKEHPD